MYFTRPFALIYHKDTPNLKMHYFSVNKLTDIGKTSIPDLFIDMDTSNIDESDSGWMLIQPYQSHYTTTPFIKIVPYHLNSEPNTYTVGFKNWYRIEWNEDVNMISVIALMTYLTDNALHIYYVTPILLQASYGAYLAWHPLEFYSPDTLLPLLIPQVDTNNPPPTTQVTTITLPPASGYDYDSTYFIKPELIWLGAFNPNEEIKIHLSNVPHWYTVQKIYSTPRVESITES
jgi:hypothetical protein